MYVSLPDLKTTPFGTVEVNQDEQSFESFFNIYLTLTYEYNPTLWGSNIIFASGVVLQGTRKFLSRIFPNLALTLAPKS